MLISLGILGAAAIGAILHVALPFRDTRGFAVTTLVAAALGAIVWSLLTWIGAAGDNPLLWIAILVVPGAITAVFALVLARVRHRADAEERKRLRIA